MLASGRPVVAGTAPHTGLAREMAACGLAVVPELPAAMAGAISVQMDDATLWQSCATNARARALDIGSPTTIMDRSDEHTSELQSLMRTSYAVFCLNTKITRKTTPQHPSQQLPYRLTSPP